MYKLWKWLFLRSKKELKDISLNKYHNDIKCPYCNEWFSISGVEYKHKILAENELFIPIICGQCKNQSNWSPHIAPFLVLVDDTGSPLNEK